MTTYQHHIYSIGRTNSCQGNAFRRKVFAVVDRDHLYNRGKGNPRAALSLDVFSRALAFRGVCSGTAFSHYYTPQERKDWRCTGLKLVETRMNCDWHVSSAVADFVDAGCNWLILVSGDGDFLPVVRLVRRLGVKVEVWVRCDSACQDLLKEADRVRFIDDMIHEPTPIFSVAPAPLSMCADNPNPGAFDRIKRTEVILRAAYRHPGNRTIDWSAEWGDQAEED